MCRESVMSPSPSSPPQRSQSPGVRPEPRYRHQARQWDLGPMRAPHASVGRPAIGSACGGTSDVSSVATGPIDANDRVRPNLDAARRDGGVVHRAFPGGPDRRARATEHSCSRRRWRRGGVAPCPGRRSAARQIGLQPGAERLAPPHVLHDGGARRGRPDAPQGRASAARVPGAQRRPHRRSGPHRGRRYAPAGPAPCRRASQWIDHARGWPRHGSGLRGTTRGDHEHSGNHGARHGLRDRGPGHRGRSGWPRGRVPPEALQADGVGTGRCGHPGRECERGAGRRCHRPVPAQYALCHPPVPVGREDPRRADAGDRIHPARLRVLSPARSGYPQRVDAHGDLPGERDDCRRGRQRGPVAVPGHGSHDHAPAGSGQSGWPIAGDPGRPDGGHRALRGSGDLPRHGPELRRRDHGCRPDRLRHVVDRVRARHHEVSDGPPRAIAARLSHRADGRGVLHRYHERVHRPGLPGAAALRILSHAATVDTRRDSHRSLEGQHDDDRRSSTMTARAGRWIALAASIILVMTAIGCSRGPDATALRAEVQGKLDQRFKPGLFELVGLRRQGSAPLPGSESGAKRLAVYFNATLKLAQGYDFGNWEGLSPGTLAQVLGATEKGIVGVKADESRPGDLIKVYGSSTYEWVGDRWQSVDATTAGVAKASALGDAAPSSRSKQLIDRLAALVDTPPPGVSPEDDKIVSEELDQALRAITARRERRQHIYIFASGPENGEYYAIAEAVIARVARLREKIRVHNLDTQGSVENVRLIGAGQADYAFVQSNVAAMAPAGEGAFAGEGAVTSLRALGSLFPEPVHIVVSAASGIRTVADLRGKRVAIGTRDSGTRADALAVLAVHGLALKDLAEVRDEGLEAAADGLRAGRLDAFFATIGAPTLAIQRLAIRHPIRLVSLDAAAIERLVTQHSGLVPLLIPANTYPGQKEDRTAIAATALLVTRSDVPDAEVGLFLKLLFENPDVAAGSAQGAKISKRSALRGITIPLHPAASRYFGPPAPPAPGVPAAQPKG